MTHSHPHSHTLRGPSPLGPLAAKIVVGVLVAIGMAVVAGAALLWPSQEKVDIPLPFQNAAGSAVTTEAGHVLSTGAAECGGPSVGAVLTSYPTPGATEDAASRHQPVAGVEISIKNPSGNTASSFDGRAECNWSRGTESFCQTNAA